jgi:hypothetical protein
MREDLAAIRDALVTNGQCARLLILERPISL